MDLQTKNATQRTQFYEDKKKQKEERMKDYEYRLNMKGKEHE